MRTFLTSTLLAASTALALLASAGAAEAAPKHKTLSEQADHFRLCLNLLLTDPAAHAKQCGPGHPWDWANQTTTGFDNPTDNAPPPPPVTTTTPPPVDNPCEKPPCPPPPCHPCPPPPCWGGENSFKPQYFGRHRG